MNETEIRYVLYDILGDAYVLNLEHGNSYKVKNPDEASNFTYEEAKEATNDNRMIAVIKLSVAQLIYNHEVNNLKFVLKDDADYLKLEKKPCVDFKEEGPLMVLNRDGCYIVLKVAEDVPEMALVDYTDKSHANKFSTISQVADLIEALNYTIESVD